MIDQFVNYFHSVYLLVLNKYNLLKYILYIKYLNLKYLKDKSTPEFQQKVFGVLAHYVNTFTYGQMVA